MKKYIIALLTALSFTIWTFGKIITVSNNPNSPGQYIRLDSAINAASAGDILLVSGSVTDYGLGGTVTINKRLTLYGQGYDPRKDQALPSTISTLYIRSAASGTIISGFNISYQLYEEVNTNSIVISRCRINQLGVSFANSTWGINGSNYDIRENIIGQITINNNDADIHFHNNIIYGPIHGQATNTNILIYNNYFTSTAITSLSNALIYNNIFYSKSAAALSTAYTATANCVYNNNIYFNTTNANPLGIGVNNNSGSNNINVNPLFVNIDLTTTSLSRADNFNLQSGSRGTGAGTDGRDIGLHGGSLPIQYPYSGQPAIPQIQAMNILNPVIAPTDTLKISFRASSNN